MKKIVLTFGILVSISIIIIAQSPKAFKYQAVARDVNGDVLINKSVSFKISILKGSTSGTIMYSETHNPATNGFGLVNLDIGSGTLVSGNFANIDWGSDKYFIRIELDAQGGTNYQVMGTSQLLSVPYALYAERAGNDDDADSTNELQVLSFSDDTLYLQNGGFVYLGTYLDNTDNQILSLSDDTLHITNGNFVNLVFNDNDSTNELQALSISNDTIFLANGGFVKLPAVQTGSVPVNTCLNSISITPPTGYTYSGDQFTTGISWIPKAILPTTRAMLTASVVNNKIYVIGGYTTVNNSVNINEVYDPATNSWTIKANMITSRHGISSAVVDNKIYVFGGSAGSTRTNINEEYDPQTNTWTSKTNLSSIRIYTAAVALNNKIYVLGGVNYSNHLALNEEYDPLTNTWSVKANMPIAQSGLSALAFNNKIYAFGIDTVYSNQVYDPSTNSWTTKAPMLTLRRATSAAILNNKFYVFGGESLNGYLNSNEEYDPINDTWTTKPGMPTARSHTGIGVVNNKIYVLGGKLDNSYTPTNKNEEFTPRKTYYIHCKN